MSNLLNESNVPNATMYLSDFEETKQPLQDSVGNNNHLVIESNQTPESSDNPINDSNQNSIIRPCDNCTRVGQRCDRKHPCSRCISFSIESGCRIPSRTIQTCETKVDKLEILSIVCSMVLLEESSPPLDTKTFGFTAQELNIKDFVYVKPIVGQRLNKRIRPNPKVDTINFKTETNRQPETLLNNYNSILEQATLKNMSLTKTRLYFKKLLV